jgi:hypothetical protein
MNKINTLHNYSNQLDKLHSIIKAFHENFPENLFNSGISPCEECDGAGIPVQGKETNLKAWNIGDYCVHCNGIGYVGIITRERYVCKKCKGEGCDKCNFTGKVNWLDNLLGD